VVFSGRSIFKKFQGFFKFTLAVPEILCQPYFTSSEPFIFLKQLARCHFQIPDGHGVSSLNFRGEFFAVPGPAGMLWGECANERRGTGDGPRLFAFRAQRKPTSTVAMRDWRQGKCRLAGVIGPVITGRP